MTNLAWPRYATAWLLAALLLSAFSGCGSTDPAVTAETGRSRQKGPIPPARADPALDSPYLNTAANVNYVGVDACVECHQEHYESYAKSGHSEALSAIEIDQEPPDGSFDHGVSGRSYQVYRKDGKLWHRESVKLAGGKPLVLNDLPMDYAIGSGHHSRSYLVEIDGFMVESPITWYASRQAWGISPGYDRKGHLGFERPVDEGCVFCHAGRVSTVEGSLHRLEIHETVIGCENCHGAGQLHVQQRQAESIRGDDLTIVNPLKLDRQRLESVCSQCHLHGDATAFVQGRRPADFRPGLLLTHFRTEYALEVEKQAMEVVGHTRQMRGSRCWQQSEMTCTSCHQMHNPPAKERRVEYFVDKCLACHSRDSCGLPMATRIEKQTDDNCVACHMPRVSTDIPHFAFTHHRVGIHTELDDNGQLKPAGDTESPSGDSVGTLALLEDAPQLPDLTRQRNLALAYLGLANKGADKSPARKEYQRRALEKLEELHTLGSRDGELLVALAACYWDDDPERAGELAEQALEHDDLPPLVRINALTIRARTHAEKGRLDAAHRYYQQIVKLRRDAMDYVELGRCRMGLNSYEGTVSALEQAARISPGHVGIRDFLAEVYRSGNEAEKAQAQSQRANELRRAYSGN